MHWLTPRRRLLISAPLAIILPAGLLTFLGLRTIRLLDVNMDLTSSNIFHNQMKTFEYCFEQKIRELEHSFEEAFEDFVQRRKGDRIDTTGPPLERIVFEAPLQFAKAIFYMRDNKSLFVYERSELTEQEKRVLEWGTNGSSAWKLNPHHPLLEQEELIQNLGTDESDFLFLSEPKDLDFNYDYASTENEEFVVGVKEWQVNEESPYRIYVGIVYDEKWVAANVLPDLLNRDFFLRNINIIDRAGHVVAPANLEFPANFKFRDLEPPVSNEAFKECWSIRFPERPDEDYILINENNRAVFIPLIIAAICIMILAVLGAIRNLARELSLAEMRSTFVAKVSHELRTPLGLIRLFAETLELGRYRDQQQGTEYLHTITKESERLSRLIDNVLDFSQIEAGHKQYQLRLDRIDEVINTVADLLRFHAERHGLTLVVQVEPNLPKVRFDRAALEQAIWNLASNAIKYSGQGKVITLNARRGEREVIVEVQDEGIGIHPREQKKVFEQFFRVDDPRVQEQGGSGLGLAVVKHIIEGHGGRLSLDSQPGRGSTFGLHLPLQFASAEVNM